MTKSRNLALWFCLLAAAVPVSVTAAERTGRDAVPVHDPDSLEVLVYFRKGYSTFDPSYMRNSERLLGFIREAGFKDTLHIRGTASPEGEKKLNDRLSLKRANSLYSYIKENAAVDGPVLMVGGDGIDWAGLRSMTMDSQMPHKEEVLGVIGDVMSGKISPENANKVLLGIGSGEAWQYMYLHFFPRLRTVSFRTWGDPSPTVIGHRPGAECPEISSGMLLSDEDGDDVIDADVLPAEGADDADVTENRDAGECQEAVSPDGASSCGRQEGKPASHEPFHLFALKTNFIYDVALMPNLEFEWLINEHWSVSVEGDVAWWKNEKKHQYYQVLAISPECRWWFRTFKPWHGHYLGLMAGGGLYDLENRRTGYKGEAGFAGLTYGFMWPVGRNISFDAEVGAGYMYTKYEEYEPLDGHYVYQRTRSMNYFGPLKLKFSLVWRFADRTGRKKGGAR